MSRIVVDLRFHAAVQFTDISGKKVQELLGLTYSWHCERFLKVFNVNFRYGFILICNHVQSFRKSFNYLGGGIGS